LESRLWSRVPCGSPTIAGYGIANNYKIIIVIL
jgi:hypothetical protein